MDKLPRVAVAFRSDWSKRWPDQGICTQPGWKWGFQQSPGWAAVKPWNSWFIDNSHVKAVGHETFDTDAGIPATEHETWSMEYYLFGRLEISTSWSLEPVDQVPQLVLIRRLLSLTGQGNWFTCPCHCHLTINKEKKLEVSVLQTYFTSHGLSRLGGRRLRRNRHTIAPSW